MMLATGVLQIRPFEADDIRAICARHPDAELVGHIKENAEDWVGAGPAFTGLVDGTLVAAAGLIVIWPGVANGWCYTSVHVPRYAVGFHRHVKRHMERLVSEHALHRIHVEVPVSHTVSRKWVQRLGFHMEGVMQQYGPDKEDFIRYVRLF